jgi:Fe-S-cluster containining protein
MSKTKTRTRKRRPRTHPVPLRGQPAPCDGLLGGLSRQELHAGADALTQTLAAAIQQAQARTRGGYPDASVMGTFLAPLKETYQAMDLLSAALRTAPQSGPAPACTAGCCACCRLYVEIGPWEAFAIADYVTQVCEASPPTFREAVLTVLRDEVTRYVDSGGNTVRQSMCAFLGRDGQCGIYPARPSACRTYYSPSRQACEQYFFHTDMDGNHPVLRSLDQGIGSILTLAETLAPHRAPLPQTACPPMYEMQSAVLRILETPNALVRYLHGEDILAGCARLTDEAELTAAHQQLVQLHIPPRAGTAEAAPA